MNQHGQNLCLAILIGIVSSINCIEIDSMLPEVKCLRTNDTNTDPNYLLIKCSSTEDLNGTHPYLRYNYTDAHIPLNRAIDLLAIRVFKMHTFTNDTCDTFPNTLELYATSLNIQKILPTALNNCRELKSLSFQENNLTEINSETFSSLSKLISLDLSDNNIATLEPGVFSNLINIKYIALFMNKLVKFPAEHIKNLEKLQYLQIYENNIEEEDVEELKKTFPKIEIA